MGYTAGDDQSLLDALIGLRRLLDDTGQPTRVCWWSAAGHIQSLDVTGQSTNELNLHRATLANVSATLELTVGPRRLLAHVRCDMLAHQRIERLVRCAGFELVAVEPTPVAIARLAPDGTMRLAASRGSDEWWVAVVHDRAVMGVAPRTDSPTKRGWPRADLLATPWSAGVDAFRERLIEPAALDQLVNSHNGVGVPPSLRLVGDPYPDFPETDSAWGPRIAGALGAAVAAAGLAGGLHQLQPLAPDAGSESDRVWVVERVGDAAAPAQVPARRFRLRRSAR
ncbi:MAG: hypothetical protein WCC60_08665 [Ilumatobacteraceae bacterium]